MKSQKQISAAYLRNSGGDEQDFAIEQLLDNTTVKMPSSMPLSKNPKHRSRAGQNR